MKEIKFRAKSKYNGEWVYAEIHGFGMDLFGESIDEETICQYTGLKDKHGNEIYAGDILHVIEYENKATIIFNDEDIQEMDLSLDEVRGKVESEWHGTVECDESCMVVGDTFLCALFGDMRYSNPIFDFEVIGNIHDNKLLID